MTYIPPIKTTILFELAGDYTTPSFDTLDFLMDGPPPIYNPPLASGIHFTPMPGTYTPPEYDEVHFVVGENIVQDLIDLSVAPIELTNSFSPTIAISVNGVTVVDLEYYPLNVTNSFGNITIQGVSTTNVDMSASPLSVTNSFGAVSISVIVTPIHVDLSSTPLSVTGVLAPDVTIEIETPVPSGTFVVKSVVLDITNNYGATPYTSIRSIDFWFEGVKISNLNTTNFVASATSRYSTDYAPAFAFDTSITKIGPSFRTEWLGITSTSLRLICVFNNVTSFDEIRINNSHDSGGYTTRGAKDVKIYTSTDTVTDLNYGTAVPNSELIFDDTFLQHPAVNDESEEILTLTGGLHGTIVALPPFTLSNAFEPISVLRQVPVPSFNVTSELSVGSIFSGQTISLTPFEMISSFGDITVSILQFIDLTPFELESKFDNITIDGPPPDGSVFFDFEEDNYFPPPYTNVIITLSDDNTTVVNLPPFTMTSQFGMLITPHPPGSIEFDFIDDTYVPTDFEHIVISFGSSTVFSPDILSSLTLTSTANGVVYNPITVDILSSLTLTSAVDISPFIACVSKIQTSSELTFFAEGYEFINLPISTVTCSADVTIKGLIVESNFVYDVCIGQTYSDILYWNTQNPLESFDQSYVNMLISSITSDQEYTNGLTLESDQGYVNQLMTTLISDQDYNNMLISSVESTQEYINGFTLESDQEYINQFMNVLISDQDYSNAFTSTVESDQEYINGLTLVSDFEYYTPLGVLSSDCSYNNNLTESVQSDMEFINSLLEFNPVQSNFVYTNYLLGAPSHRIGNVFKVTI